MLQSHDQRCERVCDGTGRMPVALVIDVTAKRCWNQHEFLTRMQERVDVLFVKRFNSVCYPFVHNSIEVIPDATLHNLGTQKMAQIA